MVILQVDLTSALLGVGCTLIVALILWLSKQFFDKYFTKQPRLFLRLGKDLCNLRLLGHDIGHELTWRFETLVQNQSPHTAYKIELWEVTSKEHQPVVMNQREIKYGIPSTKQLKQNENLEFRIAMSKRVPPEVLLRFRDTPTGRIFTPGLKIANPEVALRPKELDSVQLILKYENERGRVYYTKFSRVDKIEKNAYRIVRPYWFQTILK
jgi:hypothetical protein